MKEKLPAWQDICAYDGNANIYVMHKQGLFQKGQEDGMQYQYQYASRGSRKREFIVTIRKGQFRIFVSISFIFLLEPLTQESEKFYKMDSLEGFFLRSMIKDPSLSCYT